MTPAERQAQANAVKDMALMWDRWRRQGEALIMIGVAAMIYGIIGLLWKAKNTYSSEDVDPERLIVIAGAVLAMFGQFRRRKSTD